MFTYTISPVNCEGSLNLDMKINGLSKSRNANKGPIWKYMKFSLQLKKCNYVNNRFLR